MGIYKKGNVYWFKKVHNGKKVEKSLEVRTRREAEKKYADLLSQILSGAYFQTQEEVPTMMAVISRYMREVSPFQKGHQRNREIADHLVAFFEDKLISDVTVPVLSSYKAARLTGDLKFGKGKGKLAGESTVKKELSFLRQVFNKAIDEWELCKDNPVKKVIKGLKDIKRVRYILPDEAVKLPCALSQSPLPYLKEIVIIGCGTGLRESKIVGLTVSQCDFHNSRINIAGDEMKNEEPFSVSMTGEVKATLQKVLNSRSVESPYVFAAEDGQPYAREAVSMAFHRACRQAGIQNLRFHDLRHDFASLLINNGASLYQVQHALGQKDQRMSARYAHLLPENRDVVAFIDGKGTATILLQSGERKGVTSL